MDRNVGLKSSDAWSSVVFDWNQIMLQFVPKSTLIACFAWKINWSKLQYGNANTWGMRSQFFWLRVEFGGLWMENWHS